MKHSLSSTLILTLILCLLIPNINTAPTYETFTDARPKKTVSVPNLSPRFEIDLDIPEAFSASVESFSSTKGGGTSFCDAYPSMITSKLQWTDKFKEDSNQHSYDNIGFYKGYFFFLDTYSFNILVAHDLKKVDEYLLIESEHANIPQNNGQIEEPFLLIDTPNDWLYVVSNNNLYPYNLQTFMDALQNGNPEIPKLSKIAGGYRYYDSILAVQHYKKRIYIVADNVIDIYQPMNGDMELRMTLDSTFFNLKEISMVDIAFKEKYAFLLDRLNGVLVVELIQTG